MTLCAECGQRPLPPRQPGGRGRPRTRCLTCSPRAPREVAAARNEREKTRAAAKRHARRLIREGRYVCGCGRDYAAVPLGQRCPRPLDPETGELLLP